MADLKEAHLFRTIQEQQRHWYYRLKLSAIRQELARVIGPSAENRPLYCLDIGAGNGVISKGIGSSLNGIPLQWDLVDTEYQPSDLTASDQNFRHYLQAPKNKYYDLVIAIDVIEHVPNDNEFSASLERCLTKNGILILCAPAFRFLWSPHDTFLGHQRRYKLNELSGLLKKTTVFRQRYLYQSIFPIAVVIRLIARAKKKKIPQSDLKIYPSAINEILFLVALVGEKLTRRWPLCGLFPGLSCLVVARNDS